MSDPSNLLDACHCLVSWLIAPIKILANVRSIWWKVTPPVVAPSKEEIATFSDSASAGKILNVEKSTASVFTREPVHLACISAFS